MPATPCSKCQKVFNKPSNLTRHLREVHNEEVITRSKPATLKCPLCSEVFERNNHFVCHIEEMHDFVSRNEKITFKTVAEFESWKICLEKEDKAKFTIRSKTNDIIYYRCNRSGLYRAKVSPENRKRELKNQGSCKTNFHCPASIIAKVLPDESVDVTVEKAHFGHEKKLAHLPLSSAVKTVIATKLAANISLDYILDDIQATLPITGELDRAHLITKQDLRNIMAQVRLDNERVRHSEDSHSPPEQTSNMSLEEEKNELIELAVSFCSDLHSVKEIAIAKKAITSAKNAIEAMRQRSVKFKSPQKVNVRQKGPETKFVI